MKCSFMYTINEEEIYTSEIHLPKKMNFSEVLDYIQEFISLQGHDFNSIVGISILIKEKDFTEHKF